MKSSLSSRWRDDEASDNAMATPNWRISSFQQDGEKKRVRKTKVYSILGAAKYTMILSLLLWWLPLFGQMIAGYVGGRKAGSPFRGLIAGILPVIALFAVITTLDFILQPSNPGTGSATSSLLASFGSSLPIIGPYFALTNDYIGEFVKSLTGASPYGLNSYIITLAFAYIGGILADQTRREIEAVSGGAGSHTTLVVTPNEQSQNLGQAHYRPSQPSIPGMARRSRNPFLRGHHGANVNSFDQLVPEEVTAERDEHEFQLPKNAEKTEPRRLIRKLKHPSAAPARHAHERKPMRIDSNDPNTIIRAQKKIEKEWNPKKKRKVVYAPVERYDAPKVRKKKSAKGWDSI